MLGRVRSCVRRFGKWTNDRINKPWKKQIEVERYRTQRSASKLVDIQQRFKILRPGMRVLDLGSSPGGWAQVAVEETKSTDDNPLVFCVDEKPMPDLLGTRFLQKDINEEGTPNAVLNFLRDPVDVVLSDVVHQRLGERDLDCVTLSAINLHVIAICGSVLKPGGVLLTRMAQGNPEPEMFTNFGNYFKHVQRVNAIRHRRYSRVLYYLAEGFRQGREVVYATEEEIEERFQRITRLILKSNVVDKPTRHVLEQSIGVSGTSPDPAYDYLNDKDSYNQHLMNTEFSHLSMSQPVPESLQQLLEQSGNLYEETMEKIKGKTYKQWVQMHKKEGTLRPSEPESEDGMSTAESEDFENEEFHHELLHTDRSIEDIEQDDPYAQFDGSDDEFDNINEDFRRMSEYNYYDQFGDDRRENPESKLRMGARQSKYWEKWQAAKSSSNVWDDIKRKQGE